MVKIAKASNISFRRIRKDMIEMYKNCQESMV